MGVAVLFEGVLCRQLVSLLQKSSCSFQTVYSLTLISIVILFHSKSQALKCYCSSARSRGKQIMVIMVYTCIYYKKHLVVGFRQDNLMWYTCTMSNILHTF